MFGTNLGGICRSNFLGGDITGQSQLGLNTWGQIPYLTTNQIPCNWTNQVYPTGQNFNVGNPYFNFNPGYWYNQVMPQTYGQGINQFNTLPVSNVLPWYATNPFTSQFVHQGFIPQHNFNYGMTTPFGFNTSILR